MTGESEMQQPTEMNPEDLPEARAFQDEFTRQFLQSTEETRPGYYLFQSGTGKYTMDFPAGGIIGEKSYALKEDETENIMIGVQRDDGEVGITVSYNALRNSERVADFLASMERKMDENLEFEKNDLEEQTIYFSEYTSDYGNYNFIGYIQSKEGCGGIEFSFTYDSKTNLSKEDAETEAKNILQSVRFDLGKEKVNDRYG